MHSTHCGVLPELLHMVACMSSHAAAHPNCTAVTLVGAAWLLRRRRQQTATMDANSKLGSGPVSLDSSGWIPPSYTSPNNQSSLTAQASRGACGPS